MKARLFDGFRLVGTVTFPADVPAFPKAIWLDEPHQRHLFILVGSDYLQETRELVPSVKLDEQPEAR